MKLAVTNLETSRRVKVRASLHKPTVERYTEAYKAGAVMPPLVVFREKGTERYVLADGTHRLEAAKRAGIATVEIELREGDETDALKFALRSNTKHGLLRRDSDLVQCIRALMAVPELSDRYRTHEERAELLGVSYKTFQRAFVKWRKTPGGSKAEQEAKAEAETKAAKHTPPPKVVSNANPESQKKKPTESKPEKSELVNVTTSKPPEKPAPKATPAQRQLTAQVRESDKRRQQANTATPKPNGGPTISTTVVMDFQRGLACFASIPRGADLRRALNGKINWQQVEHAHAVLTELLADRRR